MAPPAAVTIRPESVADAAAIHRLHCTAFTGPGEANLVDDLRAAGDLAISLVAEDETGIVGHVALSRLRSPDRALALAPVAVCPDRQRRSVGHRLITAALSTAREQGAALVFVLGDAAYYGRFGFDARTAVAFPSPYAGPHFMALRLTSDGGTAADVVYPEAFHRL